MRTLCQKWKPCFVCHNPVMLTTLHTSCARCKLPLLFTNSRYNFHPHATCSRETIELNSIVKICNFPRPPGFPFQLYMSCQRTLN